MEALVSTDFFLSSCFIYIDFSYLPFQYTNFTDGPVHLLERDVFSVFFFFFSATGNAAEESFNPQVTYRHSALKHVIWSMHCTSLVRNLTANLKYGTDKIVLGSIQRGKSR